MVYETTSEPLSCVQFDLHVHCSKGTYIRTLAEDIGIKLGVGAHLVALHRTAAGPFEISQSKTLKQLEAMRGEQPADVLDAALLPMDATIIHLNKVELTPEAAKFFVLGQAVMSLEGYRFGAEEDIVRVFSETGDFLGVGKITEDSNIQPKRVVVQE